MTRPIVGLSEEKTVEVVGRVKAAIADGAADLPTIVAKVGLDQGLVVAAARRLQEDGELITDDATRTFSLKD